MGWPAQEGFALLKYGTNKTWKIKHHNAGSDFCSEELLQQMGEKDSKTNPNSFSHNNKQKE